MGTIITVHGTNASGPETGGRWWQRGSPFEKQLRCLVNGKNGEFTYRPLIWDGWNSETSRRGASEKLCALFAECENAGEQYVVIGHSHGGSIIAHSLLLCARGGQRLNGLSQCVTVGTPFIRGEKEFLLFSRLGLLGKAAYLAAMTFGATYAMVSLKHYDRALAAFTGTHSPGFAMPVDQALFMLTFMLAYSFLPFLVLYAVLRLNSSRKLYMYRRNVTASAKTYFAHRFVSLWHQDDEALQGLRSVTAARFRIIRDDFAVPIVSLAFTLLVPGIVAYGMIVGTGIDATLHGIYSLFGLEEQSLRAIDELLLSFGYEVMLVVKSFLALIVLPVVFVFFPAIAIIYLLTVASRIVSSKLSGVIDTLTWQEIRRAALAATSAGRRWFRSTWRRRGRRISSAHCRWSSAAS